MLIKTKIAYKMKMYFIALLTLYLVSFKSSLSQWNEAIINQCNTANEVGYLTKEEKAVVFFINLVRVNPKLFAQTYLISYLDSAPIKKSEYIESLMKELKNMQPMDVIEPQYDLYEVAKKHATEMGMHGKTGHISLSGESYETRAKNLSKRYQKAQENCQYGYSDALSIVIDLLIDEDIPDLSHRKSLLNKEVKYIGASIKKHKIYRYNCVIEMGYTLKNP
jgi:hypothetical protein